MLLGVVRNRPVEKGPCRPTVSFIITAYNEENRIREKLLNTLQQDYPRESFDVVVASDCSTDGTDDLVRSFFVVRCAAGAIEHKGGERGCAEAGC